MFLICSVLEKLLDPGLATTYNDWPIPYPNLNCKIDILVLPVAWPTMFDPCIRHVPLSDTFSSQMN